MMRVTPKSVPLDPLSSPHPLRGSFPSAASFPLVDASGSLLRKLLLQCNSLVVPSLATEGWSVLYSTGTGAALRLMGYA